MTGSITRKNVESRVSAMIPRLYIICRSWGCAPDICDEIVQEAITSALTKYKQLRKPASLEIWLISILNNCHRMYWRTRRCDVDIEEATLVDNNTPDNCLESERTVRQVREAISRLSEEHRKVIVLVDMEGLSYREVSDALNILIGTVMSRVSRARENLWHELSQIQNKKEDQNSTPVTSLRSVT